LVGDALVAEGSTPACYDSSLGSNPNISQEYKMGDKGKGVANTARQKNIQKETIYCKLDRFI
jgi:hypothetical protein